ncbi:hypothetical protein ACTMTJ_03005 [Phytohabitans sp. LJ34]
MSENGKFWRSAGAILALAAMVNQLLGWFDEKITAWLRVGSAACALMAVR